MPAERDRPELMTYCRVMQVGPACPHPCGGCAAAKATWAHDHWANIDREGVCHECFA